MKKKSPFRFTDLLLLLIGMGSWAKQINTTPSSVNSDDKARQKEVLHNSLTGSEIYNLVWEDNFNYTGLPNSTIWDYEVGFVRNEERQYYTQARPQNAYVQNGNLELTAIKEQYPNAAYVPGSTDWRRKNSHASYTSASLTTRGKKSWKYGRMEVLAKLPQGNGMWPAIWMMGTNISTVSWPRCGEVDVLEYFGKNSTQATSNFHYANATGGHLSSNGGYEVVLYPYSKFCLYRMDWDETHITISVDNAVITTLPLSATNINGDNAFRKPFFWLLNYALGSYAGSPYGTVDDTKLPAKYLVDYVKIYKSNLVVNGGLENTSMSPWIKYGTTAAVITDASKIRTGLKAIKVSGTSPSSIEQVITGLKPNTTYIFGGYGKVDAAGQKGQIGAKNFNSAGTGISSDVNSTSYTHGYVSFTTGPTNTSAKVYYYRPFSGSVYGDDFYLNEQE